MIWLEYLLSLLAGGLLGAFFFGGLGWTVQKITGSNRPYLITLASFLVRTAAVLAGFYLLLLCGWAYLLFALAGFIIVRTILAYKLKPFEHKGVGTQDDH